MSIEQITASLVVLLLLAFIAEPIAVSDAITEFPKLFLGGVVTGLVTGVMSTLTAAIAMSVMQDKLPGKAESKANHHFWSVIGHMANAIVFIIMGVTITLSMFQERWLARISHQAASRADKALARFRKFG